MAKYVNFYRGLSSKYDSTAHADGIYFATDTRKILMNGQAYGGGASVVDVQFSDGVLTVQFSEKVDGAKESNGKFVKEFQLGSSKYTPSETNKGASTVALGGIAAGTTAESLKDKSVNEILDMLLYPEFAPMWTDATASLTYSGASTLEVGATVPAKSSFTGSGNAAKAIGGSNTATGGVATDTITSSVDFGSRVTSPTTVTITLSRAYAAGSTQVKSNKGTATNKTASNSTTLLGNASSNSNIDATKYTIKAITKTAAKTITYVRAIYASTVTAGTTTKQSLSTSSSLQLTLKAGVPVIELPATYTNVKVQKQALGQWFDASYSTPTTVSHDIPGGTLSYKRYVMATDGADGLYKVSFTVA